MARPGVVCVGEALIDFIAAEMVENVGRAGTFVKEPGGAVANVAVGLSRLGVPSRLVGKSGSDPFGRYLRELLAQEGVDTRFYFETDQYPTGLVFVALDRARVPRFWFFGDPSADMTLSEDEVGEEALADAAFLHVGTVSMAREECRAATFKLIRLCGDLGIRISFDPNFRLHLWKDHELLKTCALKAAGSASLIKLNREELLFMTGEADPKAGSGRLLELGAKAVVVTLGPGGAFYMTGEGRGQAAGFEVEVVDTTGAGDGFAAGLLAAFIEQGGWPRDLAGLSEAARFANAVGALVCTRLGAMTSMPGRGGVVSFLAAAKEVSSEDAD